ncbi:hypothetical protein CYMTET_27300, partial [Cymbomonas tetramitiformis]
AFECGGVQVTLQVLENFSTDPVHMTWACKALWQLTHYFKARQEATEHRAVELLLYPICKYLYDPNVVPTEEYQVYLATPIDERVDLPDHGALQMVDIIQADAATSATINDQGNSNSDAATKEKGPSATQDAEPDSAPVLSSQTDLALEEEPMPRSEREKQRYLGLKDLKPFSREAPSSKGRVGNASSKLRNMMGCAQVEGGTGVAGEDDAGGGASSTERDDGGIASKKKPWRGNCFKAKQAVVDEALESEAPSIEAVKKVQKKEKKKKYADESSDSDESEEEEKAKVEASPSTDAPKNPAADDDDEDLGPRYPIGSGAGSEIQEFGCGALANLAMHPDSRRVVARQGGIQAAAWAMRSHVKRPFVNQEACRLVANVAQSIEFEAKAVGFGCMDVVIDALLMHDLHSKVQEHGCRAVANMCQTSGNEVKAGVLKGIRAVVGALKTQVDDVGVIEHACRAIVRLAVTRENRDKINQAGGVKALAGHLRQHLSNEVVQEWLCHATSSLLGKLDAQGVFAASVGVANTATSLKEHIKVAGVQEYGCLVLAHLALSEDTKVRYKVVSCGGIECAVNAMKAHPEHAGVQEYAAKCIANISHDKQTEVTISKSGCIRVLLDAFSGHPLHIGVQEEASRAMANLSRFPGNEVFSTRMWAPNSVTAVCTALTTHTGQPVVVEEASRALAYLVVKNDMHGHNRQLLAAKLGATQAIIAGMAAFSQNENLQRWTGLALANLAQAKENKELQAVSGGVERVVSTMNTHSDVGDVQMEACMALANLAETVDNKARIHETEGTLAIVAAMNNHLGHFRMQYQACRALANLAEDPVVQAAIIKLEAVEAVVQALEMHIGNVAVQEEGVRSLANVAELDQNKFTVASTGGIEALVAGMTEHLESSGVQRYGCRAVANLMEKGFSNNLQVKHLEFHIKICHVTAAGGVECVVKGMVSHISVIEVQEEGCKALANLAENHENKSHLASSGAIEAVLNAMKVHNLRSNNAIEVRLLRQACRALSNLAVNEQNELKLMKIGGIEAVLAAMAAKEADLETQRYAIAYLGAMAIHEAHALKISALGGIEAVVKALGEHAQVPVQEESCRTLATLAQNHSLPSTVASKGAIEAVIKCMALRKENCFIQEYGCLFLGNIAGNGEEEQEKVANKGGIEAVVAALEIHRDRREIQEEGCRALTTSGDRREIQEEGCRALARLSESSENKVRMGDAGAIEAVLKTLNFQLDESGVVKYACWALAKLTEKCPENEIRGMQSNGVEMVAIALKRYPDRISVQEYGQWALLNLTKCGTDMEWPPPQPITDEARLARAGGSNMLDTIRSHPRMLRGEGDDIDAVGPTQFRPPKFREPSPERPPVLGAILEEADAGPVVAYYTVYKRENTPPLTRGATDVSPGKHRKQWTKQQLDQQQLWELEEKILQSKEEEERMLLEEELQREREARWQEQDEAKLAEQALWATG